MAPSSCQVRPIRTIFSRRSSRRSSTRLRSPRPPPRLPLLISLTTALPKKLITSSRLGRPPCPSCLPLADTGCPAPRCARGAPRRSAPWDEAALARSGSSTARRARLTPLRPRPLALRRPRATPRLPPCAAMATPTRLTLPPPSASSMLRMALRQKVPLVSGRSNLGTPKALSILFNLDWCVILPHPTLASLSDASSSSGP